MNELSIKISIDDSQLQGALPRIVDRVAEAENKINSLGKSSQFGSEFEKQAEIAASAVKRSISGINLQEKGYQDELARRARETASLQSSLSSGTTSKIIVESNKAKQARISAEKEYAAEVENVYRLTSTSASKNAKLVEMSAKAIADFQIKENRRVQNEFINSLNKPKAQKGSRSTEDGAADAFTGAFAGAFTGAAVLGVLESIPAKAEQAAFDF